MKIFKQYSKFLSMLFILTVFATGCGGGGGGTAATDTSTGISPTSTPIDGATGASLNGSLSAVFPEALDSATVNSDTFTLVTTSDGTPVDGVVSYANNTVLFDPTDNLDEDTEYTATITQGVLNEDGDPVLDADLVWSFTTGATADTTAPTVHSTDPVSSATETSLNGSVSAIFSEALEPATVSSASFTLATTIGGTSVAGVVSYASKTMVFNPDANLAASTEYTATITTTVADLAGNTLAADEVWSFTTGATADTTAPTVELTDPTTNASSVSLNRSVSALFSEALNPGTVSSATFKLVTKTGSTPVAGAVSYANKTMVFNPTADLTNSTEYTATITTMVSDLAGNTLAANKVWSFTTVAASDPAAALDTVAPTVISTVPDTDDTLVPLDRSVSALFSEALDPATVNTVTFTLATAIGNASVAGVVSYANKTMVFNPTADLLASTEYTATITNAVEDLAGNTLAVNEVWSFTTGTAPAPALAPVNLGTAGDFVILAKTGISTTGVTAITGDIGISPAARSYITGFSDTLYSDGTYSTSSLVTGKIYASNMTDPTPAKMTTAISDMETAFTDAAGRTLPDYTELYAGDVSGKILTPGLYKWGTGLLITDVGVTISGSSTDVWIFQIAGDLTVNNGAIVTLAGGAMAKNIFWQVEGGAGASLGTTADFKGIILAQTAISINTGATVNGRLLSQTAVTLDANAVTKPAN